ncbi:MAG: EAL domain-containing protein, partial [Coriobacteriales bacterium]
NPGNMAVGMAALDDYGTGYSNLHRIVQLPFANIKIDRLFLLEYQQEQDILLPTIVHTLKERGYSVTAEGVEDAQMLEVLTGFGCDFVQGYYFSRPLPPEQFAAYVDAERARLCAGEQQR